MTRLRTVAKQHNMPRRTMACSVCGFRRGHPAGHSIRARRVFIALVRATRMELALQELADQAQELDMGYGSDSGNTKPAP